MRRIPLILLLLLTSLLISCSYATDFVVVNESERPIEVIYKHKRIPGDENFNLYTVPAKIAASQLSAKGGNEWQEFAPTQYRLIRESRTVGVRVMPGEALRIRGGHNYGGHDDAQEGADYPVEEISIEGANGGLKYTGQKARTAFSKVSRALYTLTYK